MSLEDIKKALDFYADRDSYAGEDASPVMMDRGFLARRAITRLEQLIAAEAAKASIQERDGQ